ncbi:hypothetical protein Tco_1503138 [Tanacetum coccineum]
MLSETNKEGSGVGLVLIDLEEREYSHTVQLNFHASEDDMDYEALLAGLAVATKKKERRDPLAPDEFFEEKRNLPKKATLGKSRVIWEDRGGKGSLPSVKKDTTICPTYEKLQWEDKANTQTLFAQCQTGRGQQLSPPSKHGMDSCDAIGTPMATSPKLNTDLHGALVNQKKYQSMAGSLMYLTASRPYIVYATCLCARYQAKPIEKHLKEVKRIFRYLKRTIHIGVWYPENTDIEFTEFSDAHHASCPDTCKSTSDGVQFLGEKLVSWSSKK